MLSNIFASIVDEYTCPTVDPKRPLRVNFVGEAAEDVGGPRKEYLRLGTREVYTRLTIGPEYERELLVQPGFTDRKLFLCHEIMLGKLSC